MTQPTIKKYRKRVSDERVERAAMAIYSTKELGFDFDKYHEPIYPDWEELYDEGKLVCLEVARAALEANAEVIEMTQFEYWNLGKKRNEWEEITNDNTRTDNR